MSLLVDFNYEVNERGSKRLHVRGWGLKSTHASRGGSDFDKTCQNLTNPTSSIDHLLIRKIWTTPFVREGNNIFQGRGGA